MAFQANWGKVEELVTKAKNAAAKAKEQAAAVAETASAAAAVVVSNVEVGGIAFAFGYMRGRYGDVRFAGIPIDVGAGGLLSLASLGLILSGNTTAMMISPHVNALGAGALACGAAAFGAAIGAEHAAKKKNAGQPNVSGWNVVAGGPPAGQYPGYPGGPPPPVDTRWTPLPPAAAPRPLTQEELAAAAQWRAAA